MRPSPLYRANRPLVLLAAALLLGLLRVGASRAQDAPPVDASARVYACGAALDRVALAAEAAEWQAADGAFNQAVDTMDAARADLEPLLGEAAATAFGVAYLKLGDLDVALRSEDAARVRASVAEIKQALSALGAGGLAAAAPAAQIGDWQRSLSESAGHRDAGRWIPMRNAALTLYDQVLSGGPAVERATGPEGLTSLAMVRVFAMRLFIAALDQDAQAGRLAEALAAAALDQLLRLMGAERVTATPAQQGDLPQLRAFLVSPDPAGNVSMPLKAEQLPPGGLGAFEAQLRYSPRLLRLLDVTWSLGRGQVDRDDAAGQVALSLAQAPTGPSEDLVVATLTFQLLGRDFQAEDYLPSGAVLAVRDAMAGSRKALRLGDLAGVGRAMTEAYLLLAPTPAGRQTVPRSIGDAFAEAGLPDRLSSPMLAIIEQVTEPSLRSESVVQSDTLLEQLDSVAGTFEASLTAYGQALRGPAEASIPVLLHLSELRDTSGVLIQPARGVGGHVLLDEATPTPAQPTVSPAGPATQARATAAAPATGAPAGGDRPGAGRGALVIVFLVLVLALAGAWLAGRQGGQG